MKNLLFRRLGLIGVAAVCVVPARAFNNDGKTDILWRHYVTGDNYVWLMNGTTALSSVALSMLADVNWKMVGTGDFNRDGQLDILWRNTSNGQNIVWFMNGTTFLSSAPLMVSTDLNWEAVGTMYFHNGNATDKHVDIVWRNKVTGDNAIWIMNGTTWLNSYALPGVYDLNWKIVGTGDFNGDGFQDLVWRNSATGANAIWYFNVSGYYASSPFTSNVDTNWEIVGTGYFNGDNKVDLLWRHKTLGDNAYWYMDNTTVVGTALISSVTDLNWKVGGTGDSKVDTDGDGLPDLWERVHLGTLAYSANDDPDGDGLTNLQEYQSGTDPSQTQLRVRISRPRNGSHQP